MKASLKNWHPYNFLKSILSNLGVVEGIPLTFHNQQWHLLHQFQRQKPIPISRIEDIFSPFKFALTYSTSTSFPCLKFLISNSPLKLFNPINSFSSPPCLRINLLLSLSTYIDNVWRLVSWPNPRGIWFNSKKSEISRCLRLMSFSIFLGSSWSSEQSLNFIVCKFSKLVIELGRVLRSKFQERSKYLKCFNLPIEFGTNLILEPCKSNKRKNLKFDIIASQNDSWETQEPWLSKTSV